MKRKRSLSAGQKKKKEATLTFFEDPSTTQSSSALTGVVSKNVFQCSDQNLLVMLFFSGESKCFFGAASIQCIAGEICVDGYDLRGGSFDRTKMHHICAPFRMGRPALFRASNVLDPLGLHYKHNRLKYRLKEITPHADAIMRVIGDKQPAVLVVDISLPMGTEVVSQMGKDMLVPYSMRSNHHLDRTWFYPVGEWQLYEEESVRELEKVMQKVDTKRNEGERCVILPCAAKGAGKSTFVRHLANSCLKPDAPPVYLLDVDVGQSEFTPAGCMSLWKITKPMLAVPWAHQEVTFTCSYFFGCIHAADASDKYKTIFDRLLNEFNSKSEPGSLLIVNTMGWIEGKGEELLDHIVELTQPFLTVTLPSSKGMYTVAHRVSNSIMMRPKFVPGQYTPEPIRTRTSQQRAIPAYDLREFAMVSYMAPILPRNDVGSLNEAKPYSIGFSEITFAVPEDYMYVKDQMFFGTINAQMVALCTTDSPDIVMESRRLLDKPYLPCITPIAPGTPLLKCLGFGLIRGIDLENEQIFFFSPLPPDELEKVTIMARGTDIIIPHSIIASQMGGSIPYLSQAPQNEARSTVKISTDLFAGLKPNPTHPRGFYPQK